jgi:hypothetical protein
MLCKQVNVVIFASLNQESGKLLDEIMLVFIMGSKKGLKARFGVEFF